MPTCDLRRSIGRIRPHWAAALLIATLVGCTGRGPLACAEEACERTDNDDGGPDDAGFMGAADAGASDAGPIDPAVDAATPPPDDTPGISEFGRGQLDNSCSDGLDNDDAGGADCADRSCGASPYCCVGSTDAACCTTQQSPAATFATCTELMGCGGVTSLFGSPTAQLEDGRFVPNGDEQDSGLVLGAPVDGRTDRLHLEFQVETPLETCDCADAVAMGVGVPPTDDNPRPLVDVAVMVRRAYGDIALVVNAEVVWSTPYTAETMRLTLDLAPDGTAQLGLPVEPDGVPVDVPVARWTPRSGRRVLLYGRTPNRSAEPEHAAIASASVLASRCDVPSALERAPVPVPAAGAQPTVAAHGGTLWMATADEGQIAFHHETASGWEAVAESPLTQTGALSNPELAVEDGALVLYAEETTESEVHIVRYARSEGGTWSAPTPVTLPLGDWGEPSVLRTTAGTRWLAATRLDEGTITLFRWNDTESVYLEAHTFERGVRMGFDEAELADPELVEDAAGLIRLYYAGRRGTRWGIGMQLSTMGSVWRRPGEDEALWAGSGNGHDALSVRAPAVWMDGSRLHLFHTASDGLSSGVGLATEAL